MSYDPTIPQNLPPGTVIVDQIRTNFSQYATIFGKNHSPLNSSTEGKHTNVLLQGQLADPIVDGSFNSLFSKSHTTTSSTSQELFVKIPQFLPPQFPNNAVQMTLNTVNVTGSPQYQSFLMNGYIIYWGTIPNNTNAPTNVTVSLSPNPKKIVCVIPNPTVFGVFDPDLLDRGPLQIGVVINSSFQFTITSNKFLSPQVTGDIKWLAIAIQ